MENFNRECEKWSRNVIFSKLIEPEVTSDIIKIILDDICPTPDRRITKNILKINDSPYCGNLTRSATIELTVACPFSNSPNTYERYVKISFDSGGWFEFWHSTNQDNRESYLGTLTVSKIYFYLFLKLNGDPKSILAEFN